jgi:hypothetical protein
MCAANSFLCGLQWFLSREVNDWEADFWLVPLLLQLGGIYKGACPLHVCSQDRRAIHEPWKGGQGPQTLCPSFTATSFPVMLRFLSWQIHL